jgi:hypothetical protein
VNLQYAKSMYIGTYTVKDELIIFINLQYAKHMYIGTYTVKDELIIFIVPSCIKGLPTGMIKYMLQYGDN